MPACAPNPACWQHASGRFARGLARRSRARNGVLAGPPVGEIPPARRSRQGGKLPRRLGAVDLETLDALIARGIAASREEAVRWALARIRERPAYPRLRERPARSTGSRPSSDGARRQMLACSGRGQARQEQKLAPARERDMINSPEHGGAIRRGQGHRPGEQGSRRAAASDSATGSSPATMSTSTLFPGDIRAAAEVHRELGPEYSDAVVASFLDKVDREIAAQVEARIAGGPQTPPAQPGSRRALLTGIAIGVAVSGIPLILIALIALTGGQAPQVAVARPMPPAAGGNVTQVVVTHSTVTNPGWFLLWLVMVALCTGGAVLAGRQRTSRRTAAGMRMAGSS